MSVIAFTSVRAPYGWLGNMSPYALSVDGTAFVDLGGVWRTAEALFQASRFADPAIREEIRACASPMQAKMVAKSNVSHMVVTPRGEQDLGNMEKILRLKLSQHPDLRRQLGEISSDVLIVEDVSARASSESNRFWGAALVDGEWLGENRLGKLWMRIRREISTPSAQGELF